METPEFDADDTSSNGSCCCTTCSTVSMESAYNSNSSTDPTTDDCPDCAGFAKFTHEKFTRKSVEKSTKNFVGNLKKFRIENNRNDIRIVGNENCLVIANNTGNLQIIGNNNKLQVHHNTGRIKYTGNYGRIYLGNNSKQQCVNYVGCNGILKVVDVSVLEKCKNVAKNNATPRASSKEAKIDNKYAATEQTFGSKRTNNIRQWEQFEKHFQCESLQYLNNLSKPNRQESSNKCSCKSTNSKDFKIVNSMKKNFNIVHNRLDEKKLLTQTLNINL